MSDTSGTEDAAVEQAQAAVDLAYMRHAIVLAKQAGDRGEVPVGAVVVKDGKIIGVGANQPIGSHDPSAHAEIVALRSGGQQTGNYRLTGSSLYVTLEPCPMCLGAMVHARIARIVFAAHDPKTGALGGAVDLVGSPAFKHRPEIQGGVLAEEAAVLLKEFFAARR